MSESGLRAATRAVIARSRAPHCALSAHARAAAVVLALLFVLGLTAPRVADAHAFLVRTVPEPGARLDPSPDSVLLEFSESVVAGSERISVATSGGDSLEVGPIDYPRGGAAVRAGLPRLEDGVYRVSWRVLATDSHVSAGEFAFAVGESGALLTSASASSASVSWPGVAASWLLLAGLTIGLGGLVSEAAIWNPIARRHGSAVPGAPVGSALILALAGACLSFLVLVVASSGGDTGSVLDPGAWAGAAGGRPGLLTATLVVLLAYAVWLVALRRTRALALVPLTAAAFALAWRGHSGVSTAAGLWWAAPANAVHLLAAGLWLGALVHLTLLVARGAGSDLRTVRDEAIRRYASLALPTVLLLLAAGVATAFAELATVGQLLSTVYGRLLLIKMAFVILALGLAVVARWRALPGQSSPRATLVGRLTRGEGIALLAALAVSAVLVSSASPRTRATELELLGPSPLTGPVVRLAAQVGLHAVFLGAAPGQLQVRVIAPGGDPRGRVRLPINGVLPDGRTVDLYPRSCGPGCFSMAFDWPEPVTEIAVRVADDEWPGGRVAFTIPWPPQPDASDLLGRVVKSMSSQREIKLTERVSSGPSAVSGPYPVRLTGEQFIAQELYVASGADDVRVVEDGSGSTSLVLYLPGSWTWYRLWIDDEYRIRREEMVNPGHFIERIFEYERQTRLE